MRLRLIRLVPPAPWWVAGLLAVAVMLVGLGSASIAVVSAVYDGRVERTGARAPVLDGGDPSFLFAHVSGNVGLAPVAVTYLEPLKADAPLPPGMASWPGPGEIWVSPAVVGEAVVEKEYGLVVGVIGPEGLGSPAERLVYVRPASGVELTAGMEPADSYGQGFSLEPGSEQLNVKPAWLLWLLIALFILCPSAVLLGVAVLCGVRAHARGLARLEILGATPRLLVRIALGSIAIPVVVGAVVSLGVLVVGFFIDIPLPGYAIDHGDMQSHAASILMAWLAGVLVAGVASAVLTYPRSPRTGTRPREAAPRYRGWVAACGAVGTVACGYVGIMEAQAQSNGVILFALIGTVIVVASTPFVLGWVLRWIAAGMARTGWMRGAAGRLVAGRDLQASLRAGARLATVNAVIIFTITQASMFNVLGMNDAASAEAMYRTLDGKAAVIDVPQDATGEQVEHVFAGLPSGNTAVMIDAYSRVTGAASSEEWVVLTAQPEEIEALGLMAGVADPAALPQPFSTLVHPDAVQRVDVVASDPVTESVIEPPENLVDRSMIIIGADSAVDVPTLRRTVNEIIAPGWNVEVPGEDWRVGAWITAHQSRWVGLTGSIGAVILLAAVWLRALDDNRETTRRLGLLGAALGGERIARAASGWRIAVTTALGVLTGALVAWQYSGMVTAMGAGIDPPYGLLVGLCAIAMAMGVLVWLVSIVESRRAMASWRPGKDQA